jgi:hypothetical protein
VESQFSIVGVVRNGVCEAEQFLTEGENSEKSFRDGLRLKLQRISEYGFQNLPDTWSRLADRKNDIWELRHGALRLFYFKGIKGQIAVCVCGGRKKSRKADRQAVAKTNQTRLEYWDAVKSGTLKNEDEEEK